jgi:di/tricarboxylate transporter
MTFGILLLLVIIGISLVLFSIEKIPPDMVALGVLLTLILTGLLPPEEAFKGFGSDTVVLIFGLLILTAALSRTGVVDIVGKMIVRRTGKKPNRLVILVMGAAGLMSSFISNTAATAFFIPVAYGLSRRTRISASKLLMPIAFATILSSSVSLVATSTNIVVSGLMTQSGLQPMGMFELAPVGIPILILGLAYMIFIGIKMIPARTPTTVPMLEIKTPLYLTEALIKPNSPWVGKSLVDAGLGRDLDLNVIRILRGEENYLPPEADLILEAHDILLVEGQRDHILNIRNTMGIDLQADVELSDPRLQSKDERLVEAMLMIRSPLIGRTLRGMQFRHRFGIQVLAIQRHGETISRRIGQVILQLGDILLLQGHHTNISSLQTNNTFRVLGEIDEDPRSVRRAPIALGAFIIALLLATLNILPLSVAVLLGVLVVFVTRCITPVEAYREVEWKVIILIGCMLGVGSALTSTGAAEFLAHQIIVIFGAANPLLILGGFFILTMLLTQPMSNQAAAVVVVPIALQAATHLGLNPRTFAMMIAVAASCSYLTPLEPACLMVYGPGDYRFMDFLKVGSLLTVIIFLVAIVLVPLVWPL